MNVCEALDAMDTWTDEQRRVFLDIAIYRYYESRDENELALDPESLAEVMRRLDDQEDAEHAVSWDEIVADWRGDSKAGKVDDALMVELRQRREAHRLDPTEVDSWDEFKANQRAKC